ncbi:Sporozoite surface protein 2 [Senna tora]|uniref:Sporozoite surface protein 2 n=1 Tax=Senna tora TaxID=362788 RepID=A0A835CJP4_9FABA|nr:Sporozoite surface protein 2 [Senna tora]
MVFWWYWKCSVDNGLLFYCKVHHGGTFEHKAQLEYVGGESIYWEKCDMDRWSFFEMKGDLDAMGYKGNYDLWYANPNGRLEDQLKPIIDDTEAMDMARPVEEEGKTSEGEDEEESSEGEDAQSSDDNNEEAAEEGDNKEEVHTSQGGHNVYGSEDSYNESVEDSAASITFGDSEEEDISKGFDIVAEVHNVFEIETENENQAVSTSKARGLSDEEYEFEQLMSEYSDEDEDDEPIVEKKVFPRFKPIKDMTDYKFDLGTIFGSKIEFVDAVETHAVHNGQSTKFIKNDKQRVRVICVGGTKVRPCLWTLTTMKLPGEETWQLRVCHNTHTCSRDTVVKLMSADWLARKFESKLRSNPKTKIMELVDMAKRKWSETLKKGKANRAKKIALEKIHGSNTEQFKRLFDFCHELLRSNLSSMVKLSTCDAPNMQSLGLLPSISELLPNVDQRFCVRHLYNNFRKKFPGQTLKELMWKAAKSTYPAEWFWSKSRFNTTQHCDAFLNNMSETFNSVIVDFREKPILTMLEAIREYLMNRWADCRRKITTHQESVLPRIKARLEKQVDMAGKWIPQWSGDEIFEVTSVYQATDKFVVDLQKKECSCRAWMLTGIPCCHSIAAMKFMRKTPDDYIPACFRKEWPGRPKKRRRKATYEKEDQAKKKKVAATKDGKRKKKKVAATYGHNRRRCPAATSSTPTPSPPPLPPSSTPPTPPPPPPYSSAPPPTPSYSPPPPSTAPPSSSGPPPPTSAASPSSGSPPPTSAASPSSAAKAFSTPMKYKTTTRKAATPPRVRSFVARTATTQGTATAQGTTIAQGTAPPNTRLKAKPRKRTKPPPPWK